MFALNFFIIIILFILFLNKALCIAEYVYYLLVQKA